MESLDELCRLCGSEEGFKVSIFEPGSENVMKIHKILPISINEYDSLPKNMCHRCSFKVNDFYEFRINSIRAQDMLKSKLPWMNERKNMTHSKDDEHPPMVELPLSSINFISPGERHTHDTTQFIDENEPFIVIDDDSPPFEDIEPASFRDNHGTQEKIVMKIKRSQLKKKPKSKSIWETRKRRKRTYNSCRITKVFTTTLDEYENIGNVENDPLGMPEAQTNDSMKSNHMSYEINIKNEQGKEKGTNDGVTLPTYILVTNIPRVGFVYTCEKCGRTFLSPQPASLHVCHGIVSAENESIGQHSSSNNTTDFYSCNECNQVFSRQSQLIAHKKKHCEIIAFSSDDSIKPPNRRKKHRKKNKVKLHPLKIASNTHKKTEIENGIIRHSLLSSDSD